MIRNLTPHEIALVNHNGTVFARIPSSGVARAKVTTAVIGHVEVDDDLGGESTVPLVRSVYGEPVDLPDAKPGTYNVVSLITAQSAAATGRDTSDLLLTQDLVRDADGRVIGARSLSPFGA